MRILLPLLMLSSLTFGQIQVQDNSESQKEVWNSTMKRQSVNAYYGTDTTYAFFYQDLDYQQIVEIKYISFSNRAELTQFLDLVEDVINNKKDYTITLASDDRMSMKKYMKSCRILILNKGWTYVDMRTVAKIREAL